MNFAGASPATPKEIVLERNLYPNSTYTTFIDSFKLLHKVALLVTTFKLTVEELEYLSLHGTDFAGVEPNNENIVIPFDLNKLPIVPSDFAPPLFNQWLRLYDLITLRDSLPNAGIGLTDIFRAASFNPDGNNVLSEGLSKTVKVVTGWDAAEFTHLIEGSGFSLFDSDFKNEIWLIRLKVA